MRLSRILVALASVGAILVFAGNALASTQHVPMGYCGPSFTSKAAMISFYQSHPAQRARAEVWVRLHASYYHIQPDQSFIAWLSMPNVKFKKAPAGYTLQHNTRCDAVGNVIPYDHKLGASKLPMLMWCKNAAGSGSGCTPIAKFYCRNFVIGRMVFPKPSTPSKPGKPAQPKTPTQPSCQNNGNTVSGSVGVQIGCGNTQWCVGENVCNTPPSPPAPCGCTPPPVVPPVVIPPPVIIVTPPPTIQVANCTRVQEVPEGQQYNGGSITCDVTSPKGDTIKVVFGAAYGHFSGSAAVPPFTSTGIDTVAVPSFYIAPADIPPGGNDTLTIMLTDLSNSSVKPVSVDLPAVQIDQPDVHPSIP